MKEFDQLLETIRTLRSPRGCPWDRAQKVSNMKGYLLEETYELIDGINRNNIDTIKEELGDIFLIIIVINEMFKEKDKFDLAEVLGHINKKLISRHPHVFSSKKLKTKEEVLSHWIKSKARTKKRKSIKDRLPHTGPALLLASILFKELNHLDGKKPKKNELSLLLSGVSKKLNLVEKRKNKKKLFTDIVFDMCRIAFFLNLDLEGALREKILNQAQNTSYQRRKK